MDVSISNWAVGRPVAFEGVLVGGWKLGEGWVDVKAILHVCLCLPIYGYTTCDSIETSSTSRSFSKALYFFPHKGDISHMAIRNPKTCLQHSTLPSTCLGHYVDTKFVGLINPNVSKLCG